MQKESEEKIQKKREEKRAQEKQKAKKAGKNKTEKKQPIQKAEKSSETHTVTITGTDAESLTAQLINKINADSNIMGKIISLDIRA